MTKARDAANKAPVAATLTGAETLENKTLDDPILNLVGSEGTAGQVPVSQGAGLPPVWSTPSGAPEFTASGAITQGGVLQLRSNGTVEQVAGVAPSTGSTVALKAGNSQSGAVAVSSTGTVVIAFADSSNSNRLSVVVGAVSGTSISFGTAVQVNTDSPGGISVAFMDATNFCIHYGLPASLTSQAVVGTVSGTTATFGTKQQVFSSSGGNFTPLAKVIWMPNVSRLLFAGYIEPSAMSFNMVARAASVSGTVMTLGTQINVSTNTGSFSDLVFHDGVGRAFFAWVGSGNTTILGRVLSVSGTTVSLGGQVTFVTGATSAFRVSLAYDSVSQRILAAWLNNSSIFTSHVSISGTTPSILATSTALGSGTDFALDFSVTGKRFLLRYRTDGTAFLLGIRVSGTAFFTDPVFSYNSTVNSLGSNSGAYSATANKLIVNHTDSGTLVAVAQVIQPLESNLETDAKVLGISQATVADGVSVPVAVLGNVDANQSGLTVNDAYYVNYLGALTTAATNNVLLGRAVAATKLLVTKGI